MGSLKNRGAAGLALAVLLIASQGCRPRSTGSLLVFDAGPGIEVRDPSAKPAPGGPALKVLEVRQDLGTIEAGAKKDAVFPVRNAGGEPLRFLSVTGTCGCLSPTYPPKLAPGARGEIRVAFEPQPLWSGKMEKRVKVKTDDPRHPDAELVLVADVIPYVRIEPPSPVVVQYRRGGTYTRDLVLTPREGKKISISGPVGTSPGIRARVDPPGPADKTGSSHLHLDIGPFQGPGDVTTTVQLATDEPQLPRLPVVVVALAQSGPVVTPREVYLKRFAASERDTELARLQVFTRSGQLQLLGVETDNTGVKVTVDPKTPGKFYEVVLRYAGGWKPGPVSGNLRVRTDDPRDPVIPVQFHGTVL